LNFEAAMPLRVVFSTANFAPVERDSSASITAAEDAPASMSAPTVMSPLIPEKASR